MYIVYTSKSKHVWLLIAKPILMTHIKQNRTYSELNNYKQKTHFTQKCIFLWQQIMGIFCQVIQYFCTGKWIVTFLWPQCMSTLIAKDFIKKENIFSIPLRIPLRITLRIPLGIYPEKNSFETFFLEPSPWNLGSQSFSKLLLNIAVILWTVLWNIFSFLIRLIQLVETPSMCLTFTIDIRTMQIRLWLWSFPGVSLPPAV